MEAEDHGTILFDPGLPLDMCGEIISWCTPPVLASLARINKVWHKRVQATLDARLVDDLEFDVSHAQSIPSLNWLGRYTGGVSHFRGTCVRVREEYGTELRLDGLPYDTPEGWELEEVDPFDYSVRACYEFRYSSDDRVLLRLRHPEELQEIASGRHRGIGLATSREQVDVLIGLIANHSDPLIRQYDPTPLLDKMRRHAAESPEGGIFYSKWADFSSELELAEYTFVFVRNIAGFLEEIRRVTAIGERHQVPFVWI